MMKKKQDEEMKIKELHTCKCGSKGKHGLKCSTLMEQEKKEQLAQYFAKLEIESDFLNKENENKTVLKNKKKNHSKNSIGHQEQEEENKNEESLPNQKSILSNTNDNDEIPKEYRAPIISVLGHVDVGKTRLIDSIVGKPIQEEMRSDDVIIKHFNAKFLSYNRIKLTESGSNKQDSPLEVKIPGMLFLDTPSNQSEFSIKNKGLGCSDLVIVVVDLIHGLGSEIEYLTLLKKSQTIPFLIAVNKIDRIFGWDSKDNCSFLESFSIQSIDTRREFAQKVWELKKQLLTCGIDADLRFHKDSSSWNPAKDPSKINLIPVSAHTGEGVLDLIKHMTLFVQKRKAQELKIQENRFKCIFLEPRSFGEYGYGANVLLIEGALKRGDNIVFGTIEGPSTTKITKLVSPSLSKKTNYKTHPMIQATASIGIVAENFDKAILGSEIYIFKGDEEQQQYLDVANQSFAEFKQKINLTEDGIILVADTPLNLETLGKLCHDENIPVAAIYMGEVTENIILEAAKPLLKSDGQVCEQHATIAALNTRVDKEMHILATENKVKIFSERTILGVIQSVTHHFKSLKVKKDLLNSTTAIFPCILKIIDSFSHKDPIILGVSVIEGIMKVGTPLCAVEKDNLHIGILENIELNQKPLTEVRASDGAVAIKIIGDPGITFGRQFNQYNTLASVISRESIDALKLLHRDDLTKDEWKTVIKLKSVFKIV